MLFPISSSSDKERIRGGKHGVHCLNAALAFLKTIDLAGAITENSWDVQPSVCHGSMSTRVFDEYEFNDTCPTLKVKMWTQVVSTHTCRCLLTLMHLVPPVPKHDADNSSSRILTDMYCFNNNTPTASEPYTIFCIALYEYSVDCPILRP